MMRKLALSAVFAISGCVYASTSTIPVEVPGIGKVYRYEGRANFPHQIAEADRIMREQCLAINGGRPVIVNLQKRNLGAVGIMNAQSNGYGTATVTPYGTGFGMTGSGTATTFGTSSVMANMNQEILYRCEK